MLNVFSADLSIKIHSAFDYHVRYSRYIRLDSLDKYLFFVLFCKYEIC